MPVFGPGLYQAAIERLGEAGIVVDAQGEVCAPLFSAVFIQAAPIFVLFVFGGRPMRPWLRLTQSERNPERIIELSPREQPAATSGGKSALTGKRCPQGRPN